jgi:general secretion pathway protein D
VARSTERRRRRDLTFLLIFALAAASGCATQGAIRAAQQAERRSDYDRAIVEYTNALRADPENHDLRLALDRVKIRASQEHYFRGRRLAAAERHEEAAVELQIATELNPTDFTAEAALRETRQRLRTKIAVSRGGKTELQSLIERTRAMGAPGIELPADVKLPESMAFSNASSRMVFTALAKWADMNVTFDPSFREERITADLRNTSLADALASLTATTRTFYRVTAQRTITIVPDTPAKRREYEEQVVQTFPVSNADLKEVIDLLRIVVDVRRISFMSNVNAISITDTPERISAAGRLISAIDKARPEVVISVELLEVDRTRLREYGLQIASPGSEGISGSLDVNRDGLTLEALRNLTQADVFVAGVPGLYYRLLKNDEATRTLASPQLRTSEGVTAQARFGERVPITVTTFAPIATGGINQQPISSYVYENIGVNIDITPRTHHDDDVSLALKVTLSNISGSLNGLPTFGNREITTTIRLKDGETSMLAGLIRDEERTKMAGIPGLSDLPFVGKLFAHNRKESIESDIILTLTPHIVRVLDLSEVDLRPFRVLRDSGPAPGVNLPANTDRDQDPIGAPAPGTEPGTPAPEFPQPRDPTTAPPTTHPYKFPGGVGPILPPTPPPPAKKKGGESDSSGLPLDDRS